MLGGLLDAGVELSIDVIMKTTRTLFLKISKKKRKKIKLEDFTT
jgi:hypothetical protein